MIEYLLLEGKNGQLNLDCFGLNKLRLQEDYSKT